MAAGDTNGAVAGACVTGTGVEKKDGTEVAVAGLAVSEKGKAEIGGSLAFVASC